MMRMPRNGRRHSKRGRSLLNMAFFLFCSLGVIGVSHWMQPAKDGNVTFQNRRQEQRQHPNSVNPSATTLWLSQSARGDAKDARRLEQALSPVEEGTHVQMSEPTAEEREEFETVTKGHGEEEQEVEGENKEEEEEGEEEEDGTAFEQVDLVVVVSIALFLILATLGFEAMKEGLEESVTEDMEVILEKLFGELTILGFLAIVTFMLTQTGILELISIKIFGEAQELLEYFEQVHYSIFFVMVFFVFQVLIMIREATETERFWDEMDAIAKTATSSRNLSLVVSQSTRDALKNKDSILSLCLPALIDQKAETKRMATIFRALREEFILERSMDDPFKPAPPEQRVDPDFNFGRYLSLAQAYTMTRIVEVEERTWAIFGVGIIIFYGLCEAVGRDIEILSWIFVAIAWATFIFNLMFERHLVSVRNKFIPKKYLGTSVNFSSLSLMQDESKDDVDADEGTYLVKTFDRFKGADLPAWCDIDVEKYRMNRNLFVKCLVGGQPNRQQALFWMDSFGPKLYFILLQSNLIFTGVYVGVELITFGPYIYQHSWWPIFTVYCILASLPVLGISYNKKRVVAALAQVSSIGAYRKPQIVSDVLLETKTGRVVRTFLIIHKMWHTAKAGVHRTGEKHVITELFRKDSFSALEQLEVSKSFDALDTDRGGSISHDEFRDLLTRLGADMTDEDFKCMVDALDADGDGEVTKEEFLNWYASQSSADCMTLQERAHDLFCMFDRDGSGEITIGEFKAKLDALQLGFSVDEIGAIVNELDRDRNGTVEEDEFFTLLRKYYPKELSLNIEDEHEYSGHGSHHGSSHSSRH